ncbi:MAG: MlaD family protein, partial [Cellvibrionaceae bacterium]|nr:MlaD family protein [Cellvibrionaceae bacterium]
LSSILTGAHIELAPGSGTPGMRRFKGLDDLPPTSASVPGTRLHLVADEAASVTVGSPILYNGYKVGRVEQVNLSTDDGRLYYGVFVEAPYNDLLSSNTRFWNASGISINAGVDGVALESQSIETLLVGGIAFALPEGTKPGDPVAHEHEFKLYPRRGDINQQPYRWGREYLVMFDSSVRGLKAKAPVEYRGIRIGTVLDVSFLLTEEKEGLNDQGHSLVPVLLRIDPGRI